MSKNNTTLLADFNSVSAKEWKTKIQADLKGEDYNNLIFQDRNGIDIKPFYHQEETEIGYMPKSPKNWLITESFEISANTNIDDVLEVLEKGTQALWLKFKQNSPNPIAFVEALYSKNIPVYLDFEYQKEEEINTLIEFLSGKNHQFSIGIDCIGHLASTGNWHQNLRKDFEDLNWLIKAQGTFPIFLSIRTEIYENAGTNHIQQVAYAMAHVNEYLNHLSVHFPEKSKNFKPLFHVSIGGNYFAEIAKLKALRIIYSEIAEAYEIPQDIEILAFPSLRNKTLYDYNVNMLRTTTEGMSAILGGANWVANTAYDSVFHHDNNFGRRIARNQLLVLKNESYFDKVSNPVDGSYYLESLTQQISEKALSIFKSIEQAGGFITALTDGTIQRKIEEVAQEELKSFEQKEKILVGTNKYLNLDDKMKNELEKTPFLEKFPRKTLIKPIIQKRLAEGIENERLTNE
ncbi:methylmalonyl-CoA mutase subunit beta [Mesonia sediminis]|uniref:Methylmalonyl-CoA mutase subunit beta n=1 Tax=Mesonia sediminis TaxID=1703946 RepID=A0ABW5SE82_9FLAO